MLHQPVDHRQPDGGVRARPRPQPEVGHSGRRRFARIDHDDTRPLGLGALERLPLRRVRRIRIASHDQCAPRVVDVLTLADGQPRDPVAQRPAAAAQVLVHHPVGRPERPQQQRQHHPAAEVRIAHRPAQRCRTVPLPHRQHRLRHLVQRLIPRHPPPPPATPRPGALHGIEHPVRMIGQLRQAPDTLHTEGPQRRRVLGVRRHLGHPPVLDGDQRPAVGAAFPAGAGDGGFAVVHGIVVGN